MMPGTEERGLSLAGGGLLLLQFDVRISYLAAPFAAALYQPDDSS